LTLIGAAIALPGTTDCVESFGMNTNNVAVSILKNSANPRNLRLLIMITGMT
jgi:hypothetical protein